MKSKNLSNHGEQSPTYKSYPWTVSDVARAFSVSRRTVADWQKQKRIPYLKAGKLVRFNPDAVGDALSKFVVREGGWR
jgi:excisionase family DNA binding protein